MSRTCSMPVKLGRSGAYQASGRFHFFAENTRPGKKLRDPSRRQAFAPVSRRPLWGSCLLAYDRRRGPCTSQDNVLNSNLDETFGYDSLNRLISASCANGNTETWTLDSLGNWLDWTVNGVSQTRSTDPSNEIGSITQGGTTSTQGYDLAGNMTLIADPNSARARSTARMTPGIGWLRCKQAAPAGRSLPSSRMTAPIAGCRRPTSRPAVAQSPRTTSIPGSRWSRPGKGPKAAILARSRPTNQYVWSLRYIDAPILRDSFDSSGNVEPSSRIYYLGDANYNVTALVNSSGTVIERYSYDPYGKVTVYDAAWTSSGSTSSVGNTILFAGEALTRRRGCFIAMLGTTALRWGTSSALTRRGRTSTRTGTARTIRSTRPIRAAERDHSHSTSPRYTNRPATTRAECPNPGHSLVPLPAVQGGRIDNTACDGMGVLRRYLRLPPPPELSGIRLLGGVVCQPLPALITCQRHRSNL